MRKSKLVYVCLVAVLLLSACASSSPFGKKHRSKRKCNCPTFSFVIPIQENADYRPFAAQCS